MSVRARPLRWAVVGLGYIAQAAVLPAFKNARRSARLTALVSGDPEKLRTLAVQYEVPHVHSYDDFERCLGEVDAVYIALPNHLHRDFTIAAAQAGVHVLCEKPLAVTEADCEAMIAAAERNRVLLMTAYRLHFERANLRAAEMLRDGEIGDPRFFTASFSQQVRPGNIRLLPEALGGGPLYDIGIYCINAARTLFGCEPDAVSAFRANNGEERFAETHEMICGQLVFPGQRLASFVCGAGGSETGWCQIVGQSGDIRLEPAFAFSEGLKLIATRNGRKETTFYPKRDQFAPQLRYFAACVRSGDTPEPSGREGLADVRVIRALLESADSGRIVELPPFTRRRRADLSQEDRSPAVDMPKLVHAQEPSPE